VTLRDDLENALYSEARKLGTSISDLRAKFEAADPAIAPAQLLVDAIQNMAVRDAKPGSLSKRIAAFAC
jgi:hypothetical protein